MTTPTAGCRFGLWRLRGDCTTDHRNDVVCSSCNVAMLQCYVELSKSVRSCSNTSINNRVLKELTDQSSRISLVTMRSMTSMLQWFAIFAFITSNVISATTLATLQKEGDAIYDMTRAMPSLVLTESKWSRYLLIQQHEHIQRSDHIPSLLMQQPYSILFLISFDCTI